MRPRCAVVVFVCIALLGIWGCGGSADPKLATPESTAIWYMDNASTLRAVTDPISFGNIMNCFSDRARSYFGENYKTMAGQEYASELEALTGTRKEAYAFTVTVLMAGPQATYGTPDIQIINSDDKTATVSINGTQVKMIREGKEWRIDELFGLMK